MKVASAAWFGGVVGDAEMQYLKWTQKRFLPCYADHTDNGGTLCSDTMRMDF
jgi:hypothetical protein